MYAQIFAIIAPILLIAAVGYGWSVAKLEYHGRFLSSLVVNVGTPCLILAAIVKTGLPSSELLEMTAITLTGLAIFFAFNALFLKLYGKPLRPYLGPLSFSNTANMGIPVCLLALGHDAMVLAIVIFMITSIVQFSLGVALVGGKNPASAMLTAPVFYATVLAFIVVLLGLQMPAALTNTLELLGGIAIPLMLLSLGVSLHSLRVNAIGPSLVMAIVRVGGGFVLGLLLCWLFDLDGVKRGVVLIQAAMPSAVACHMLAEAYNNHAQEVAGVVVFSTIVSFLTMPLLLWYVL